MKGVHKPFDKKLYKKYDGPAKDALQKHLEAQGHIVTVPPENYGVDVESTQFDIKMYHEVEVSENWIKDEHPFLLGSIPERKHRLKQMCHGMPLFFWMLRLDMGRAVVFSANKLMNQYLVEVPNRLVAKGEFFYRIPKTLGKEFDLLR